MIRHAHKGDAQSIADIYNQSINPGVRVTGSANKVTREEREAWLTRFIYPHGVWVYESDQGKVVAFFALGPFAVRPNYQGVAEISVYVDAEHRSRTIGAKLLVVAVDIARRRAFTSMLSIANAKNIVSVSGCLLYGFKIEATLRKVCFFDGRYDEVVWVYKNLKDDDPPQLHRLRDSILKGIEEKTKIESLCAKP